MKYCFNFLSIEKILCTLSLNIRYFHAPPSVDAEQSWDWVLIFFVGYKISALPPFFIRNIFVGYKVSAPLPPTKTLHIERTNMVQKKSKKCKIWRKKLLYIPKAAKFCRILVERITQDQFSHHWRQFYVWVPGSFRRHFWISDIETSSWPLNILLDL